MSMKWKDKYFFGPAPGLQRELPVDPALESRNVLSQFHMDMIGESKVDWDDEYYEDGNPVKLKVNCHDGQYGHEKN